MLKNVTAKMDPKLVKSIKIGAVLVGATVTAAVVAVVLYKSGLIKHAETVDEVIEAALEAA